MQLNIKQVKFGVKNKELSFSPSVRFLFLCAAAALTQTVQ